VRVLFGRERFTAELAWQDLGPLLPGWEIITSPPQPGLGGSSAIMRMEARRIAGRG